MDATLHLSAGNAAPDNYTLGFFTGYKGVRLRYGIFRSRHSIAKGTVVLLHGRNESIEKYLETIRALNDHGLWVATFDHRGQVESGRLAANPRLGHVRRFRDYEKDLQIFLSDIVLPDTRLPFYLIGHSTGALLALAAAPALASRIERMVLASPFLGLSGQALPSGLVRLITRLACLVGLGGVALTGDKPPPAFEDNLLTSDPARYARNRTLLADFPQLALGPPSCRWLHEAFSTIDRVTRPQHLTQITIPTLILSPTLDQLVPIAGSRHEIFQERDIFREQAFGAITAFIPGSDADENGMGASI